MTAPESAHAFAAERGWHVTDDLTETHTGHATPVLRVDAAARPAVLRTDADEGTVAALVALSDTGVTPLVYDHGAAQPVGRWVLCEWVVGEPLVVPAATTRDGIDALAGATAHLAANCSSSTPT